jgi:branched-chain amino acid transport system ATP-binding protein
MTEVRHGRAPLLVTAGLGRAFGGLQAVRAVSITLSPGELHAVIGPNGAGKSTLVNLLAGELMPTRGDIRLEDRSIAREPAWRRVHLGLGRSFQRTNIFASLSVLENVRLAAQAVRARPTELFRAAHGRGDLDQVARHALDRVGLGASQSRTAGTLAHGEQRLLEIAMTLAGRPKVLLLDEPLAGMGPEEGERIAALLRTLAADHAILLIEHDMDFVFAVADWMTVMVEGAVLAEGTPAAIRANADVQRAYLGGHA